MREQNVAVIVNYITCIYDCRATSLRREYIGCQGPIPATLYDIWRMVREQNVAVIVNYITCIYDCRATSLEESI